MSDDKDMRRVAATLKTDAQAQRLLAKTNPARVTRLAAAQRQRDDARRMAKDDARRMAKAASRYEL
jgi:hypothetical protein